MLIPESIARNSKKNIFFISLPKSGGKFFTSTFGDKAQMSKAFYHGGHCYFNDFRTPLLFHTFWWNVDF